LRFTFILKGKNIQILLLSIWIGVIAGIIIAEYVRRKIGLETFFGRIYGSNEMDKKNKKGRKKEEKTIL